MEIKILQSAQQDIVDAYYFYEKQQTGIGTYFLDSIYRDIDTLDTHAGIHPIFFKHYYRLLSKRFPFAVYYKIKQQTVFIYAVLDCRKNPAWIRKKLK